MCWAWNLWGKLYFIAMKLVLSMAVLFSLSVIGCHRSKEEVSAPAQSSSTSTSTSSASGNPITAPVDYLGAVARAKHIATKTTDMVSLQQAIQTFFSEEERYPATLKELVDKRYLPRLPAPPPGAQYVYDPRTGHVSFGAAQGPR